MCPILKKDGFKGVSSKVKSPIKGVSDSVNKSLYPNSKLILFVSSTLNFHKVVYPEAVAPITVATI